MEQAEIEAIAKEAADKVLESQVSCISAGMTLVRDHDSFKKATPIIFRVNLKGLVSEDDLKVPHSELAIHIGAAGRDLIAFALTGTQTGVATYDKGEGACGFIFGREDELFKPPLVEQINQMWEKRGPGNPGTRVHFDRADIDSAIGAAKLLKSDSDQYVFATYLGYTIEKRPPPGMQQYVIVHPDGTTETIKPSVGGNPDNGRCYEEAWRFFIKQEEGELVHGSVQTIGKRINHAWVELPTGYVWEPESGEFMKKSYFYERAEPIEEHRYSVKEAAIMLAGVGKHGPWTEEERARWLK